VRPADRAERERLGELFAELCAIPSPFGSEERVADRVVDELARVGVAAESDHAGNLAAHIPGTGRRTILLCAHMDTVAYEGTIEPVCEEGVWRNARDGAILGADNKAALAVMLLAAHRAAREPAPVSLEFLFTVQEENALAGAKEVDVGRLQADWGYVFDHATPIGEIVLASPTYHRIDAEFRGASAHAGVRPEDGRNAILAAATAVASMRLGRLDDETTANAGTIRGGAGGTNVVPERCSVALEVRSLDEEKAEAVVAEMVDRLHDGANAAECDVDVMVQCLFHGYRTRPGAPAVLAAESALRRCGYATSRIATGGGSDANAIIAHGGPEVVNLANGTERNHQPDERVAVSELEGMLDVTFALLDECAAIG
jgi:tripeptide aminopeptidase